jgi:glucokinase
MVYLGGVDIGATKISALVADGTGEIIARAEEQVQLGRGEISRFEDGIAHYGLADQAAGLLQQAISSAGIEAVKAIGIGAAGPLQHGSIKDSTNLNLSSLPGKVPRTHLYFPLVEPVSNRFGVPVDLENDCNTAVIGEVHYGAGKETEDKDMLHLVYVTVSTGFGAGVWTRGGLLKGKEGNAGEMGHFMVKQDGLKCGCGNYGCAEAYCSGRGLVKNVRMRLVEEGLSGELPLMKLAEAVAHRADKPICEGRLWRLLEFINPPIVFQAAEEGDWIAQRAIDEAGKYGGIALAGIANAYDPEIITIGGAIAVNHPGLIDQMSTEMKQHLNVALPQVRLTPLGRRTVEYGAIALAREAIQED